MDLDENTGFRQVFAHSGVSVMPSYLIAILLFLSAPLLSQQYIADYTVAKEDVLRSIPVQYINQARTQLVIAYQHTSHGTHVSRGVFGLQDYKAGDLTLFGVSESPSADLLEFRDYDLEDYAPAGASGVDLSADEDAFIQTTRNYLDAPENATVNVVMWSWCNIAGHDVTGVYLPGMDSLINEYGPGGTKIGTGAGQREVAVFFIRMTGHANVDANTGYLNPLEQAAAINSHSTANQQYCLDYYSIDTHDMDDNYWEDAGDDGNSSSYGGNFYRDWQNAHTLGVDYYENKRYPGGPVAYGEHTTQHITSNRKAYAFWWILARIAGWDGSTSPVPVTDINISSAGGVTSVVSGADLQFSAEVLPANASNPAVTWSVINETGTATISVDGLLTAGDPGTVGVVASAQDGSGVADTFDLTITAPILVESITVSSAGGVTTVESGLDLQFSAAVLPGNATNPDVTWSVINGTGTATITAGGLLTAGDPGSVQVVASAQDGSGVTGSFDLTIIPRNILVESITITSAGGVTSLETGLSLQFYAEVLPADASNPDYVWSVVNGTGTATITTGGLLTAGDLGSVQVVASAQDGSGVTGSFDLTITPTPVLVTSITISAAGGVSTVESGTALQFSAEVLPVDATNPDVTWSVTNGTGTATISTAGLLIAGDPGSVQVVASAQDGSGVSDSYDLTITPAPVPVTSIDISSAGGVTNVESGSDLQFSAEVLPSNASNPDVSWSISNGTGTATISTQGLLTAGNPGTVTIVASAVDGSGVTDDFDLTITAPVVLVQSISISSAGGVTTVQSGSTLQFSAEVLPANASNKSILWSISPETGTATISGNGLLTGGNPGTVQVLAIAMDGSGVTDMFALTITDPPTLVSSIEVSAEGGTTEVEPGETLQFYASVLPADASNKNIQWSISPITGTATISAGGLLTAGDPGDVQVVASALDGSGVTGTYMLGIRNGFIQVTSINVYSAGNINVVDQGDKLQLYATVNPSNADNKEVFWHVSSTGGDPVGSITSDGLFIALGEGQVDAIAIAQDGSGVYDAMRLTVMGPSGEGDLEQENIRLYPNPGSGLFFLRVGEMKAKRLRVLDMHGGLVLEQLTEPWEQVLELDLSQQPPGVYYVQVFSESDYIVRPIIISR